MRVSVWLCLSCCTDANALGRGGLFWVFSWGCWGFWLFLLGCLGWFGLGWFVRWPPLHRVPFSLLETSLTHHSSCLRIRLRDTGSWVTVGFGAVFVVSLVWVWWVGGFGLWLAVPLPSRFPLLPRSCPFLGLGPHLLQRCRSALFSTSSMCVPVVPAFLCLGLGWLWLGFCRWFGCGFGFWLVAGGYHGYSESLFAAVNRGLPRTICASPLP